MTSFHHDQCVENEDAQGDSSENSPSALTGNKEGSFVSSSRSKEVRHEITAQSWLATDTESGVMSPGQDGGPRAVSSHLGSLEVRSPTALEGNSLGGSGCCCILYHEGLLPSLSLSPGTFNPSLE